MEEKKQIKINLKTTIILILIFFILMATVTFLLISNIKRINGNDKVDSSKFAEYYYWNTKDEKQNQIVNNMFDAMLKQHTIQMKDEDWNMYFDLNNFTEVSFADKYESPSGYIKFSDDNSTSYTLTVDGSWYKQTYRESKKEILKYMFKIRSNELLIHPNKYNVTLSEDEKYYILEGKEIEKEDDNLNNHYEKYYINKTTNLLEKYYRANIGKSGGIIGEWNTNLTYTDLDIKIPKNVTQKSTTRMISYKPIIYLYPKQDINVNVKLGHPEKLTVSYPKYINGWNVFAKPDGNLIEHTTNKNLYSLYYECDNMVEFKIEKDGFIVKGDESATFLEEKLASLGLTEREAEEFIIYWLPKLEANKYNYIRFATNDEINENMPLEINPKPDTVIRVLMTYKGLDRPIEIEEQKLTTPSRDGFVAVEWGGTEIK